MDEFLQKVYDDAFDEAFGYFSSRRQWDAEFTKTYLEGLLESLYVRQGNNWDGRGQAKDMAQSGMIAAAELTLAQWDGGAQVNAQAED